MTLSEKIAGLLFVRIGSNMRPNVSVEDDAERVEALIRRLPIGGLVLFNGDAKTTPAILSRLQRVSTVPLLVGTDMERGLGQQLRGATVFPHAFAFGTLGDEASSAIEDAARVAAREALAAGIHISFSPVADVHSNPDNPIISIRTFGSNPTDVADRVSAYIRGCSDAGLLSTAKHFPGHGDTGTDSHVEVPAVDKTARDLERMELPPFDAAFRAGADLVMTAHVAYPRLDPSGSVATRSAPILIDLLRESMGFSGAVITDSLLMEGADSHGADWAGDMVKAGVDILLDVRDPEQVHGELLRAVRDGRLPEARIDEAHERVQLLRNRLMARFGASFFVDPGASGPTGIIGAERHHRLAERIARRAVTVELGEHADRVLDPERIRTDGLLFVLIRPHVTYTDPTAGSLSEPVRRTFPNSIFEEIVPESSQHDLDRILKAASSAGAVVVAASLKPAAWHRFGLLPEQTAFLRTLANTRPIALAALGSPRLFDEFPDVHVRICTFSDVQSSQTALVETLRELLAR